MSAENANALTYLDAEINSIEDIAPLDGTVQLTYLDLSTNYIANLGTVDWSAMPLQQLNLRVNLIEDISACRGSRPSATST